jgi:hypothetical protein
MLRYSPARKLRISLQLATIGIATIAVSGGARAETITVKGKDYASYCLNTAHVPLPPKWLASNWTDNGNFPGGNGDSYTGQTGGHIYYSVQTTGSSPGVCVVLPHSGGPFDIICQGTNGKACFWESKGTLPPSAPPPTGGIDLVSTTVDSTYVYGGTDLSAATCTTCHQGANAFITHPGSHATNLFSKVPAGYWMPSNWFDPVVASTFPPNRGPGKYDTIPGSSLCMGACHIAGGPAGRLPDLGLNGTTGYCSILSEITSRPDSNGGMPSSGNACNGNNCADTQLFVRYLKALCPDVNLALGKTAYQSSTWGTATANLGTDGNTDGNFNDGSVFHTLNTDTKTWNAAGYSGGWTMDHSMQAAPNTLVVYGNTVFGLDRFGSNTVGPALQYSPSTDGWSSTGGSFSEISLSGNVFSPTLWGAVAGGAVSQYTGTSWSQAGTFTASHVSAGDGLHPWAISADGNTLSRYNYGSWTPMLFRPWEVFITGSHPTWKLTMVSVGSDDDAWVVDTGGNIYHMLGGIDTSGNTFNFPAGIAWENKQPYYAGNNGQVSSLAVANRYNVWATSSTYLGAFNYNLSSGTWQHHCLETGGTCAGSLFTSISIGKTDSSVWAVSSTGLTYQLDESQNVNKKDTNSTDYSFVNIAGPGGTVSQVIGGGGTGNNNQQVWVTTNNPATGGGTAYYQWAYGGILPISGGAWWWVDLGDFYHVDQVRLWNRTDCCGDRISNFRIFYWSGNEWTVASDQSNTTITQGTQVIPVPVNVNTRYVMVQKTTSGGTNDYLHLAEVEVMGQPTAVTQY